MKILVVDDIKGWRDFHKAIIEELFPDCEIQEADSARSGYDLVMENNSDPFDIIITDLQMEHNFEPDYAGEWLVKQIKTFPSYRKTKIVIISATFNIRHIADTLGVECIPKTTARNFPQAYEILKNV